LLIDTHCHLCDPAFDGDREAVLERAWAAGLEAVVEIADSEEGWAKARALSEHPSGRVWWAAGFHPYHAGRFDPGLPRRLAEALRHPRAVAIGEIGLDYFIHCDVPRPRQLEAFRALARVGAETGKPLVLHCRDSSVDSADAQEDMLNVLRDFFSAGEGAPSAGIRGVAHCFQGTKAGAESLIGMGFLIGVNGPVTYPKAGALRGMLKNVPLGSLVLETDSPYLPPQAHRGRRNEPSFLPAVAEALASVKDLAVDHISAAAAVNSRGLFSLPV
jgi:TatD DNase family protein